MAQPRHRPYSTASSAQLERPLSNFYGELPAGAAPSPGARGSVAFTHRDSQYGAGGYGARQSGFYSMQNEDDDEDRPLQPSPHDFYADFATGSGPRYAERLNSSADVYAAKSPTSPLNDTKTSLLDKQNGGLKSPGSGGIRSPGNRASVVAAGEVLLAPELGKEWGGAEEARVNKAVRDKSRFNGTTRLFPSLWQGFLRWFEWKRFIFVVFAFICCLAAVLYFLVPRVPSLELNNDMPLNVTANSEPVFTRTPTIMDWDAQLNIAIDGQSNWIPFHFNSFGVTVYDLNTGKKVGQGGITGGRKDFPGRDVTPVTLDLSFFYRANNVSDETWQDFYQACSHKYTNVNRPGLSLTVEVDMSIRGIIGSRKTSASLSSVACPIELPAENA